ncbi:unnamed protein product [Ectocarpus sp. 8 AP-2014]
MANDGGDSTEVANPSLNPDVCARMVEFMRGQCTAKQWGEWLTVPVELAAARGEKELTEELLRAGAGGDPIHEAIRAGQHDVVKHLRQEPEDDHLQVALETGDEAMVSLLLELGADADPEDHWVCGDLFFTPIHLAAKAGQAGIVGMLMDAGACADRWANEDSSTWEQRRDPQYDWSGILMTENALHFGAIGGHVDVIDEIIKRQPSTMSSVAESTGYTALHYAAKHSQLGVIDALVEAGADLEAEGGLGVGTALHVAAESPDSEATLLALLRHGAKVDSIRNGSKTPLSVAVKARNVCAAKALASAGADVRQHLLRESAEHSQYDMLLALLGRGAHVNTKGASDGNTPLHLAAEKSFSVKVDVLLQAGADETAVNHKGQTPLDVIGLNADTLRTFMFMLRDYNEEDEIRTLLVNAPKDRANRAWSRRGFFVLCRAFPERVQQQLVPSGDDRVNVVCSDVCSHASSCGNDDGRSDSRNKAKRVATAEEKGGAEGRPSAAHVKEGAAAFRAAMGRLIGLEVEVVFRTVLEFV